MATYKGPDGRLYRVSEAPDAKGEYHIEYLDPTCSAVYKRLPGYNGSADREVVVARLDKLAKDRDLEAVAEDSLIPEWAVDIAKEFAGRAWVRKLECFSAACFQASSEARSHCGGSCGPGFADASPKGIKLWRPGAGDVTYTWAKFVQVCKAMGIQPAHEAAPALKIKEKTMRKRNDRCPLQAECGRTCKVAGHERDCDYYVNNRVSCGGIPDQDALLDAEERERERAWEAAQIAEEAEPATEPADPCATCLCNTCADEFCNAPGCYKDKDACVHTHNTAKCDDYRPKGTPEPATAEPQEIADESSDQGTPAATLTAAPATEIAAPAFDFAALGELAELAAEDNEQFDLHWGRAQDEYLVACVYLARIHDLTAKAGRYGGGTWTAWYQSKGISEGTKERMLEMGNGFKSTTVEDLKDIPILPRKDLRLVAGSGEAQALVDAGKSGDDTKVQELLAQLKAAEEAKRSAETRAVVYEQKATALEDATKKTQEAVEDLKQKLYRRNEELAKKEQALNVTMDQQGVYIAKMQEQEDMLADLQDRLDDTTAQLRSRPVPAEVVDQDEIERRAAELAARKIAEAEARAAEAGRSLCDVAILLKGTIDQAWQASGIDGLTPRSQDDDEALESLYQDLLAHVDALEVTMAPDCQDWEDEDE